MKRILSNNIYMLRLIARCCPMHVLLTIIISVLNSSTSVINILVLKLIVDSLASTDSLKKCITYVLLIGVLEFFVVTFNALLNAYILPRNVQIIRKEIRYALMNKAISVEYSCYDDEQFYNKFDLAISQSDSRALAVLNTFSTFVGSLFSICALSTLLATMNSVLIVLSVLGAVASIFIRIKTMRVQHDYTEDSTPIQRQMAYAQRIVYLKEYVQEIILNPDASMLVEQTFFDAIKRMFLLIKKYAKDLFLTRVGGSLISSLVNVVTLIYLTIQVFKNVISLGTFIASNNSTTQLFNQVRTFTDVLFQLYDHNLYIENFRDFMESLPDRESGEALLPENDFSIKFDNVSFTYPGNCKKALNNINLTIKEGEKIAIVGYNGSGKTTLLKMILGLYSPTTGSLLINKKLIKDYDYRQFMNSIGVVSQDYRFFALSIAENILMRPIKNEKDDEKVVWEALEFVGLDDKVRGLPRQISTPITKEFDSQGAVFSGGELQKLAIARAYATDARIIVLDEASSALDPVAETEIMNALLKLDSSKTLILCSHSMNNLKKMDRIIVMKNGVITEEGTYEQLIKLEGMFSQYVELS